MHPPRRCRPARQRRRRAPCPSADVRTPSPRRLLCLLGAHARPWTGAGFRTSTARALTAASNEGSGSSIMVASAGARSSAFCNKILRSNGFGVCLPCDAAMLQSHRMTRKQEMTTIVLTGATGNIGTPLAHSPSIDLARAHRIVILRRRYHVDSFGNGQSSEHGDPCTANRCRRGKP
jgi:hypothetical protein